VPTHAGTQDGLGLGLYIVGRLTSILGHALTLRSRVGRGTVFRLALQPTDPQAASDRAVASVAQMLPERPRVG
jgi:signal transduction histidine kinase